MQLRCHYILLIRPPIHPTFKLYFFIWVFSFIFLRVLLRFFMIFLLLSFLSKTSFCLACIFSFEYSCDFLEVEVFYWLWKNHLKTLWVPEYSVRLFWDIFHYLSFYLLLTGLSIIIIIAFINLLRLLVFLFLFDIFCRFESLFFLHAIPTNRNLLCTFWLKLNHL